MILDYDEFNIYTTSTDVENYIESLIEKGIEDKEEAYESCISHFGADVRSLIDDIFFSEEE